MNYIFILIYGVSVYTFILICNFMNVLNECELNPLM